MTLGLSEIRNDYLEKKKAQAVSGCSKTAQKCKKKQQKKLYYKLLPHCIDVSTFYVSSMLHTRGWNLLRQT